MDCFDACSIQIGDHGMYKIKDSDEILDLEAIGKDKNLISMFLKRDATTPSCATSIRNVLSAKSRTNVSVEIDAQPMMDTKAESDENMVSSSSGITSGDAKVLDVSTNGSNEADDADYEDISDDDADSPSSAVSEEPQSKQKKQLRRKGRVLRSKKTRKVQRKDSGEGQAVKAGDCVAVEVIATTSTAEVMWQVNNKDNTVIFP